MASIAVVRSCGGVGSGGSWTHCRKLLSYDFVGKKKSVQS